MLDQVRFQAATPDTNQPNHQGGAKLMNAQYPCQTLKADGVVVAEPESYLQVAAQFWMDNALEAIDTRGCFQVALSGGRTPGSLYRALAKEPRMRDLWRRVHFWFGDERCVPPNHPDSNYRMARESLLDQIEWGTVHRMEAELEPYAAAERYAAELGSLEQADGMPVVDLVMLGMGGDGHVASLFPGSATLSESVRPVSAAFIEAVGGWRLSLTLPMIRKARKIMVMVNGRDKALTLAEVFQGQSISLPATRIADLPQATWFLDRDAAQLLKKQGGYRPCVRRDVV
ncbi:MAG: 6-phosphogluconolactonase [Gammaproteobacteria bacterium]|nr:6-phosphogluconolactonase [Gammaproteobacteria bacterium]MBU1654736.1 6-phosphogluconolactonase [Gammaproteobacteria bacterium]MBU1959657.1 6-phosphogluconolactonase [Gammaproteobacteria bacterium]